MSRKNENSEHASSWRHSIRNSIRDPLQIGGDLEADQLFQTRVPLAFADLFAGDDSGAENPLLRQVLPSPEERQTDDQALSDPVGDIAAMAVPGVLHKYHGRVLLIASGACAINCRYCFRRHFPYSSATASSQNWQPAIDYLSAQTDVEEVILSGGDPLILSTQKLAILSEKLDHLPHIKRLRIHTRIPTALPERIHSNLLAWLGQLKQQAILVHHINHPDELGEQQLSALAKLHRAGITQLNQSVLLAGVNDSVSILVQLSEKLFENRVLPYYLHLLDPVIGASHFKVADERAEQIAAQLRTQLPGYLVPKMVREVAGQDAKVPAHQLVT